MAVDGDQDLFLSIQGTKIVFRSNFTPVHSAGSFVQHLQLYRPFVGLIRLQNKNSKFYIKNDAFLGHDRKIVFRLKLNSEIVKKWILKSVAKKLKKSKKCVCDLNSADQRGNACRSKIKWSWKNQQISA